MIHLRIQGRQCPNPRRWCVVVDSGCGSGKKTVVGHGRLRKPTRMIYSGLYLEFSGRADKTMGLVDGLQLLMRE